MQNKTIVYRYNIYIRYNYNGNNKYETTTLVFGEYLKNNGNKQTKIIIILKQKIPNLYSKPLLLLLL